MRVLTLTLNLCSRAEKLTSYSSENYSFATIKMHIYHMASLLFSYDHTCMTTRVYHTRKSSKLKWLYCHRGQKKIAVHPGKKL